MLPFATLIEQGVVFVTSAPVTFDFVHNDVVPPAEDDLAGPTGDYVFHRTMPAEQLPARWDTGTAHLTAPLVIAFDQTNEGGTTWRRALVDHYIAEGAALSRALMSDGYDGVVTVGAAGVTMEIVLVRFGTRHPGPHPT